MTPRLPRMYFGVRGLPVGFSRATMTASPILYLLVVDSIILLNPGRTLGASGVAPDLSASLLLRRLQRVSRADQTIDGDELG